MRDYKLTPYTDQIQLDRAGRLLFDFSEDHLRKAISALGNSNNDYQDAYESMRDYLTKMLEKVEEEIAKYEQKSYRR